MTGMRRYFTNLWLALLGTDPYRRELDELRSAHEETARRVNELGDLYETASVQIASYQTLVEVLRQSIKDKDEIIRQTNELYRNKES